MTINFICGSWLRDVIFIASNKRHDFTIFSHFHQLIFNLVYQILLALEESIKSLFYDQKYSTKSVPKNKQINPSINFLQNLFIAKREPKHISNWCLIVKLKTSFVLLRVACEIRLVSRVQISSDVQRILIRAESRWETYTTYALRKIK